MSQCQSSEFRVQSLEFRVQSHVVTTEYRQAVECEARNPCIHDRNDIKSAVGTTEMFLSCLQHLDFWAIHFCRHSALCAPYLPIFCRSYGAYLDVVETRRTQKNKHVGTYRIRPKCQRSKLGASTSSATEKKELLFIAAPFTFSL